MITNTSKKSELEQLLVVMDPGGIERSEKIGQSELTRSSQLPVKRGLYDPIPSKEIYEKMGIVVKGESKGDPIFYDVELPSGWSLIPTDHSMWSKLLDDQGRERASIFYKAAFYDRSAHISFSKRISARLDRLSFLENDYSTYEPGKYNGEKTPFVGRVYDQGKIIFETEHIKCDVQYDKHGYYTERYKTQSSITEEELKGKLDEFLKSNYPDHLNPLAYW